MSQIQNITCTILILILVGAVTSDLLSSVKLLKQQIEKLGEDKFPRIFNEKNLKEQYIYANNRQMYKLTPVNEAKIVERFSQQLENELRKKMKALKQTVDFAEEHVRNYKWDPYISSANVSYINSKNLKDTDSRLENHPLFKTKVIVDESSVHIPTEIYDEDITVLNTMKWTTALNSAFILNKNVLRYQYFASYIGLVIQYPGMVWQNKDIDMYDVRRRPWFVQGASSPKDFMILIDTSGSMTGISLSLTKIAVKKLIDTMGENDYIAIAQFPEHKQKNVTETKGPPQLLMDCYMDKTYTPCFNSFVQASKRNKERLFNQIDTLSPHGIASLEDGLKFAIAEFQKFDSNKSHPYEGANCNRIILVLTDGNDDHNRENIRNELNKSDLTKNIRIFIYSIGEDIVPIDSLQDITCDYRGFFGHIRSIGAVNNIIEKFVSVVHNHKIHEKNPLDDNEFRVAISNVVPDGFLNPFDFPPKGLGLMTSLTMPVYNRSGNGSFLGLLGTDMTVAFMNYLIPHDKLGPNGYAFAINTNGFVIFHPELKVQSGWMRDPPNVDIIEVEFNSDDKTKIRTDIINCADSNGTVKGQMDVRSFIKVIDEIHTYEKIRKYAYHGIPFSTFGVTIVNPDFNKYYQDFNEEIKFNKLKICDNNKCSMSVTVANQLTETITFSNNVYIYAENGILEQCKIIEEIIVQEASTSTSSFHTTASVIQKSSSELLPISTFGSSISPSITMSENITMASASTNPIRPSNNLTITAFNSKFSNDLMKLLTLMENSSTNNCPDYESRRLVVDLVILENLANSLNITALEKSIKSIIVAMVSGITLVYPKSEAYVYKDLFYSSWNSPIFQRTFDMDKLIFYTTLHRHSPSDNATDEFKHNDVMIFKAFSPDHLSQQIIPAAVLGMAIQQSSVMDLLRSSDACNDWRVCYLVEDGGYIISVSDPTLTHEVGYFFGEMHVAIMRTLLNNSVFSSIEEFDYQASCPKTVEKCTTSSSNRVLQVISVLPMKVMQWLLQSMETMLYIIRLSIHFLLISFNQAQEATAANNENVSCIKKSYRYYLIENPTEIDKPLELLQSCSNCNFTVLTQRFKTSNLLLITFDRNCSVQCKQLNIEPLQTLPIKDIGPDICQQSRSPNYRQRPKYKCYEFDPSEDLTKCTASKMSVPLIFTIFISTMLLKTF